VECDIVGCALKWATSVSVGGKSCTALRDNGDRSVTCTMTGGPTGSAAVVVTAGGKTSASSGAALKVGRTNKCDMLT